MSGRSAPGSSRHTWKPTDVIAAPLARVGAALAIVSIAAVYVIYAFTAPNPVLRICLRCLPVLPVAIWTIWLDQSRPLKGRSPLLRASGRMLLTVVVMLFAILLLGLGLNWLYDPNRIA